MQCCPEQAMLTSARDCHCVLLQIIAKLWLLLYIAARHTLLSHLIRLGHAKQICLTRHCIFFNDHSRAMLQSDNPPNKSLQVTTTPCILGRGVRPTNLFSCPLPSFVTYPQHCGQARGWASVRTRLGPTASCRLQQTYLAAQITSNLIFTGCYGHNIMAGLFGQ